MRITICFLGFVLWGCRATDARATSQLQLVAAQDLPGALHSIAGPAPWGTWRCDAWAKGYKCVGSPRDTLSVHIDSIVVGPNSATARVILDAGGAMRSWHPDPRDLNGFWVRWADTYQWDGEAWKRRNRTIRLIT